MPENAKQYTARILGYVAGREPLKQQQSTARELKKAIGSLTSQQMRWIPAPGKWSIAVILAHLADAEIVAGWRLRQVQSSNGVALQAYDQDAWAATLNYQNHPPLRSLEVFRVLREHNVAMLKRTPPALWQNYSLHQERGRESLAHIVHMFAGHDRNHLLQVQDIARQIREREKAKAKKSGVKATPTRAPAAAVSARRPAQRSR